MKKQTKSNPAAFKRDTLLVISASAGLLFTILPSLLNWQGIIGPGQVNSLMMTGTIIWFASAGFLVIRKNKN